MTLSYTHVYSIVLILTLELIATTYTSAYTDNYITNVNHHLV